MIRNFLIISLRSMSKNKLFIGINILGMSIAIACCIVGYFAYEYNANFDGNHANRESIYRVSAVQEFNKQKQKFGYVPLPLGAITRNMKDVDNATRFSFSWSNFKREDDLFSSQLAYVDPVFFELFSFEFIAGDAASLSDKTSVIISDKMAERLFGGAEEAYGQTFSQVYGTELKEVKVTGIFREQPMNSSFYYNHAFMNFENARDEFKDLVDDNWKREVTLFLQIENPSRLETVSRQIQPLRENNNKVREDFIIAEFTLDPFTTMAREDRAAEVNVWTTYAPPPAAIIGSGTMGILILLIACFNLTNTSIAVSSRRLKEIGIRKVMGGLRKQLVAQFLGETLMVCFASLLLGLFLSRFLLDGWNNMWEYMRLTPDYVENPGFLFFLIGVLLLTGILAGSYPALYISSFEPISILKGKLKFGGTSYLTRFLLAAQFSISLIAILSAIAFWQNARYQENYNLGFNVKGSLIAYLNSADEVQSYRQALAAHPKITTIAGASSGIYSNRMHEAVKFESDQEQVDIIEVGDGYLDAMKLTLLTGRDFIKDSRTDENESVIISEKFVERFGWKDPIGKQLIYKDSIKLFVVGVVKNVYTQGLWREMEPLMIRYIGKDKYSQLLVAGSPSDLKEINTIMESEWKQLFPYRLYNGRMLAMDFQEVSDINKNILRMYVFLGIVAMLMSATGLFTLVSLNIIRRMKEIGVRKVHGASMLNITRIVNAEFFIILAIASVLGSVLGYLSIDALMGSIWRYYQPSNAFTFIIAVIIMFVISAIAVGYKIYTAASVNPVNTLRDE